MMLRGYEAGCLILMPFGITPSDGFTRDGGIDGGDGMGWDGVDSVDHTTIVLGELSSLNHLASVGAE
jgi:hypothetical protein